MTGPLPDPRKVHLSNEKYEESIQKVSDNIFASLQDVKTDSIIKLKNELLNEIYEYEVLLFYLFRKILLMKYLVQIISKQK